MSKRELTLYLIIFLEGYVVLSSELLAIRQTLPFVGSGTDTLSIIIAAVLMPLAVGYYAGGRYRGNVRRKIVNNLLVAQFFLVPALSYYFLTQIYDPLIDRYDFKNRIGLVTLYACAFLVVPVYLLGQTVPLVSNYFRKRRLSTIAGKILFFSTFGSFLGAVLTTTILMNLIGVAYTAVVTVACMFVLVLILARRKLSASVFISALLLAISVFLNSPFALSQINVVSDNAYNTVQVEESGKIVSKRYIRLNRSYSSGIEIENPDEPLFSYAQYIDRYYIRGLRREDVRGNILVLGAGGFTIGLGDKWHDYTYVDIDPDLKDVAEEEFLKTKLENNKTFVGEPARAFLNSTDQKYDLIIMDIYRGPSGIPQHLLTREFFALMGARLKENGILVVHMVATPLMEDEFSKTLDNTIRSVYPYAARQVMGIIFPWKKDGQYTHRSVLYQISPQNQKGPHKIFTDNMNDAGLIQPADVPY